MSESKEEERDRKTFEKLHRRFGEKRARELLALIRESTSQKEGKEI